MDAYLWTTLVFGVIWGAVCANMASNRGREVVLGFIGGFIFGIFAVIYYAFASDTLEQKAIKQIALDKLVSKKRK